MKKLNIIYYTMLILAVLSAGICYYLITQGLVKAIDPQSTIGQVMQYFCIVDMLITVPGGLFVHKRRCVQLSKVEDEEQRTAGYLNSAMWRIIAVSNSMIFSIAAFYLMGGYMSMIWIAAISAIGWYFTKPTEKKMFLELLPEEEELGR